MTKLGVRRAACLMALGLFAFSTSTPTATGAASEYAFDGQIINGTNGSPPPAGLEVKLHILLERSRVGERVSSTDETGRFTFEGLEAGPSYIYFPTVEYRGASYFPRQPVAPDDTGRKNVEIRIFEPIDTDEVIRFDRTNLLILGADSEAISVLEMGAVVNQSDRTYVGNPSGNGQVSTLRFRLPEGATQVTPQAGFPPGELTATAEGFATTNPILPGRHELAFGYQIPLVSSTMEIAKRQEYPTSTFTLYVPENGPSVVSPQLKSQGTAELGGQRYVVQSAEALPRGAQIQLRIGGLPAAQQPHQLALLVTGLSIAVLGSAGLVAVLRRRRARARIVDACPLPSRREENAPAPGRTELLRAVAELDERFVAGEIDEPRYRQERQLAKERLIALAKTDDASLPERGQLAR